MPTASPIIRVVSSALLVVWTLSSLVGRASSENAPSFVLTGTILKDLQTAYHHFPLTRAQSSSLAREDFVLEIRAYSGGTDFMFAPTLSGRPTFVSVRSGSASVVSNFSQASATPIVMPGITMLEILAILDYAQAHDGIGSKAWLLQGQYELRVYIGAGMLVATFSPSVVSHDVGNVKCLSGCSSLISFKLTVRDDQFEIHRIAIL